MKLRELKDHIFDTYSIEPDHPFAMDDVSCVYVYTHNSAMKRLRNGLDFGGTRKEYSSLASLPAKPVKDALSGQKFQSLVKNKP